jgi:hypothetical protein
MRALHKEGTVHIVGWQADTIGRDSTPVYALGAGDDTPRSKQSSKERTARYRERLRERNSNTNEEVI